MGELLDHPSSQPSGEASWGRTWESWEWPGLSLFLGAAPGGGERTLLISFLPKSVGWGCLHTPGPAVRAGLQSPGAGCFDIWLVVPPQQTRLCPEQDRSRPQPASASCQWSPLSVSTKRQ